MKKHPMSEEQLISMANTYLRELKLMGNRLMLLDIPRELLDPRFKTQPFQILDFILRCGHIPEPLEPRCYRCAFCHDVYEYSEAGTRLVGIEEEVEVNQEVDVICESCHIRLQNGKTPTPKIHGGGTVN